MKIYCISGLGATHSIFEPLQTSHEKIPIHWVETNYREDMEAYAKKLTRQIDTTEPFFLLGVSFGGMLAIEMNKHIQPAKTVLISSSSTRNELPWWIRLAGILGIPKLIPSALYTVPPWFVIWILSIKSGERKKMMRQIIADQDRKLLKQCILKIVNWKNKWIPENVVRIHGDSDLLLPAPKKNDFIPIEGVGHLAIIDKSEEIGQLINKTLADT